MPIFIWSSIFCKILGYHQKRRGGGAELFASCTKSISLGTPTNVLGYQYSRTGFAYSNVGLYCDCIAHQYPVEREYIQNNLSNTLINGKEYCITLFVCLAEGGGFATDEIGAYFDDGSISTCYFCPFIATPQVKSPSGVFITDTMNWTKIQGSFIASGNESYLTIGNFRTDSATKYISVSTLQLRSIASYYIDDVSVIETHSKIYGGKDTAIKAGDTIVLGATTTLGLPCEWYDMQGNKLAASSIATVSPTTTTSYVVRMDLCGNVSYDTLTVHVQGVGINEVANGNERLKIYPNPCGEKLSVSCNQLSGNTKVEVVDLLGRELEDLKMSRLGNEIQIRVSDLASGIYFLKATDDKGFQQVVKFLKE